MNKNAVQRLRDFVCVVPENILMCLSIYVDETGTHDGSPILAVGGYVSWKERWEDFCWNWQEVLDGYGVEEFHAVEFMRTPEKQELDKDSPYRGWKPEKREQYILDLGSVAKAHTIRGIVFALTLKEYNDIFPAWLKKHVANPYAFVLQTLFEFVNNDWDNAFKNFHPVYSANTELGFVVDECKKQNSWAREIHCQIKNRPEAQHRHIGSLTFDNRKRALPIQASDLLVYRMRKRLAAIQRTGDFPPIGTWDTALGAGETIWLRYHNEETLRTIVQTEERLRQARGTTS